MCETCCVIFETGVRTEPVGPTSLVNGYERMPPTRRPSKGAIMAKVLLAITVSLDGYIAGPNDGAELPLGEGGEPLFEWFFSGDTPSKYNEMFRLSKSSAKFFDDGIDTCGAVISGRRTYDIAGAWDGNGPVPGLPLFVLTHNVPDKVPETTVPYTFVTNGIESAVRQAEAAAGDKYVALTGSQAAQQCLKAGLLDEIQLSVVPYLLGGGVRLFDHIGRPVRLEMLNVLDAPGVTHVRYRVAGR
jgi:dihydrofolate reductase